MLHIDPYQHNFNLAAHRYQSIDSIETPVIDLFNLMSLYLFYHIVIETVKKVAHYEISNKTMSERQLIQLYPFLDADEYSIFEDEDIPNKTKYDLLDLLDINSLDRHYILYYIFKLEGETDTIANTFNEFKLVSQFWKGYDGDINLDETLEKDYQVVIDNDILDCNIAHVRFLSWIYYSGIYDYLISNVDIKTNVLDTMNNNKLLSGNLFLKYQLYLISQEQENTGMDMIPEDTTEDITTDIVQKPAEENKEEKNLENVENVENQETNEVYQEENDTELATRAITEDFSEISELTFAKKLFIAVKNITVRSFVNVFNIICEEFSQITSSE